MDPATLLKEAIGALVERDLDALRREIEAYPDESALWRIAPGVVNSGGTLVLHLAGNLQHFFGATLGGTGYVRDRAAEFERRDVTRADLLQQIEAARHAVRAALAQLSLHQLTSEYPESIAGVRLRTGEYLMHLTTHLAYHLGQVDYHRRILTGSQAVVGAVRPSDLASVSQAGGQA